MTNKEIFENVFTSLEFISQWCKNYTKNDFEQNLMLMDAVAYRLYSIGTIAEKINISELDNNEIKLVNRLIEFKNVFSNPDYKVSMLGDLVYDNQLGEIFRLVFFLLLEKYEPNAKIVSVEKEKLSRDYKYPIKTSDSIWTVKKR
jgi:hypothetical protein